jgi:receptor expression-enhancing protein 1/2/3/4
LDSTYGPFAILAEGYILNRTSIPLYPWIRAGFLLYLIAPQTQGARVLYQDYIDPFLQEHETAIEDFISSAHERVKASSLSYLKQGIELLKQHLLGLPPQPSPPPPPANLSYAQALIARFNIPNVRPAFPLASAGAPTTSTATDFYTLLASAVSAATSTTAGHQQSSSTQQNRDLSNSGTLIPPTIHGTERMSFIAAQRERLSILLSALDKEAQTIKVESVRRSSSSHNLSNMHFDGSSSSNGSGEDAEQTRPASAMSGLSKSRSELDFERIEADDEHSDDARRLATAFNRQSSGASSWLPWSWSSKPAATERIGTNKSKDKESVVDTAMEGTITDTSMGMDTDTSMRMDHGRSSGIDL